MLVVVVAVVAVYFAVLWCTGTFIASDRTTARCDFPPWLAAARPSGHPAGWLADRPSGCDCILAPTPLTLIDTVLADVAAGLCRMAVFGSLASGVRYMAA